MPKPRKGLLARDQSSGYSVINLLIHLGLITPQAAQAHYVWVRASEVIWSEYTRIISALSDAK